MLVIGIAALMSLIGLSPALGTFLAGVVLANSEFRHELESNIEPFKGLLLGLFFITVGAGIDFGVLLDNFFVVIGITLGLMLLKAAVLFILALVFKVRGSDRWLFTLSLAQAGEFGFVLLSFSVQNHVLPQGLSQILALVVALSMFLTPGLFILFDKVVLPRFERDENARQPDEIDEKGTIIIAGIGRFGQVVNRLLVANGYKTVVLDHQAGQVDLLRQINIKSFFGDATRPDLLHTAGIDEAEMLVVAIDDRERAIELVEYVKQSHPNVKILARAFDRGHLYALRLAGADLVFSETFHSASEWVRKHLKKWGCTRSRRSSNAKPLWKWNMPARKPYTKLGKKRQKITGSTPPIANSFCSLRMLSPMPCRKTGWMGITPRNVDGHLRLKGMRKKLQTEKRFNHFSSPALRDKTGGIPPCY